MDAWTLLFTALCGLVVLLLVVPSVVRKLISHWRDVWREDSQQVDPPPTDEHDSVPDSRGQRLTAAMSGNVSTVAKTAVFESDVNELAKLLMGNMAGKWELFLGLLGVPCDMLDTIKQRHPHSPELCLLRGLEHWVLSGSDPTFEKIVKLLRDETPVVNIPLAHRVEEFARERQEAAAAAAVPSPEIKRSDENTTESTHGQTEGEHEGTFIAAPKRPQFPYLKTPGMSGNDRRLLEGRLKLETLLMESHFQKVVTSTVQALEAQGCTPNELIRRMLAVQTSEELVTENKPKPFMDCHIEIANALDLDSAFLSIRRYFSFFNYGIIEHIICEFGFDKACLNEYKEKFKEFCLRRVSECPINALGTQVKGDVPVVFVLDHSFENYTLNALTLFQCEICKIFDVTTFELRILNACDECVKLVFTFPSCLVGKVFPLSIDKQKLLLIHDVQKVMCNNEVVFERYVHEFLETRKQYSLLKSSLPKMGQAKRKLWCLLQSTKPENQQHLLLTGQGLLTSSSVTLDFESLNDLVRALEHPYLHPIEEVSYVKEENAVVVVQPFETQGSIKDAIYKSTPALSWPEKYSGPGEPLTRDRIARYGRQILEAMMFLYDQGFPPLNCVHSGNVLLKDGVCKLAGYAVDLLGYETLMYMISKDQKNDVDVIMFGRLLYEMSAGVELESLSPSEKEFKNCHIQEVLRFIFKQDGTYPTLKEVLKTEFFQNEQPLELEDWDPKKIYLTDDMKLVLREIRKQRVLDSQSDLPEELSAEVKQLFEEAMEKGGAIDLRIITVLLLGTAGSGKTHFKHLLIDAPPPPFRHSTPLAEAPVCAVSVSMAASEAADGNVKWRKITSKEMDSVIADELCLPKDATGISDSSPSISQPIEKSKSLDRPYQPNMPDELKSHEQVSQRPSLDKPEVFPHSGVDEAQQIPQAKPQRHPVDQKHSPAFPELGPSRLSGADLDDIKCLKLHSSFLEQMGQQKSWKKLSSRDWVFIIDSGGQPQYLQMIAPFVKHVSACTFVLKLNEGLDDHPEVAFYTSGELDYPTYKSSLTNKEILKQCCQVITSRKTHEETETTMIVVGTHRDEELSCQESRKEKNATLQKFLKKTFGDNLAFYRSGEVLFPVDGINPGGEDKAVAAEFRKFVVTQSCSLQRRLFPLKWFVLEHLIRQYADQKHVKVVATQVCIQIGRHHLKMNQEAVLGALEFLAAYKLLLFYPQIFPAVVFSDVQVLLNKLSEVVQFMEKLRSGSGSPIGGKMVRFCNDGILSLEILQNFPVHYKDGVFTPADLLKILKGMLIIADLNDGEYFMPVLLRDLPQDKVNAHRSECSVVVYSPDGWLPCGLFTSIVAFLINSGEFELRGTMHRNCVELSLPDELPGKMTLIDSVEYLEAHLDVPEPELMNILCQKLASKLKEGIDEAAQVHGLHNLRHEFGFLCSCTGQPHLAKVSANQKYWKCTLDDGGKLTDIQLLWIEKEGSETADSDSGPDPDTDDTFEMAESSGDATGPLSTGIAIGTPLSEGCSGSSEAVAAAAAVPPALSHCAQFLKSRYRMPADPQNKWPLNLLKIYLRLAVVLSDRVSREEADAFTRATLHRGIDEILCQKVPIELADLLSPLPGQSAVRSVLVEGPPGVGKSTLAWELCRRWDQLPALAKFALVVLVRFREKHVQKATKLADLFRVAGISSEEVSQTILACHGAGVFFILDGFDEFPAALRKRSFLTDLIKGSCLPSSTVLVTSRPSASADLLRSCPVDKHIEMLGFTQKEVTAYATNAFPSEGKLQLQTDFQKYLSLNPAIRRLMYIPLNCVIVTEIFRRTRKPVSQTVTKLYLEMFLVILERYLREKGDELADQLPSDLASLRPDIKDQLVRIGEMAFNAEVEQKSIFDDLPPGFEHFGFLTALSDPLSGKLLSHKFLLKTVQEFSGAFYFSQLPADEQKRIFEKYCKLEHLNVVWRFVAGLTCFQGIGWEAVMSSGKGWNLYGDLSPFLVQCFYEAQDASACDSVLGTSEVEFGSYGARVSLTLSDVFAAGWCVAASRCKWTLVLPSVGGEVCEMLVAGLKSRPVVIGTISKLDFDHNPIKQEGVAHLKELPHSISQNISKLSLCFCQLNARALDHLADVAPNIVQLEELDISRNPVGDGGAVKLLHALSHLNNLRVLYMDSTPLGCADMEALAKLVSTDSAHLKKLRIGDEHMSPECTERMMNMVLSSPSLEELVIYYLNSPSAFKLSATSSTLQTITLLYCMSSHTNMALLCLTKALLTNTSLTELGVHYTHTPEQSTLAALPSDKLSGQHSDTTKSVNTQPFTDLVLFNRTIKYLVFDSSAHEISRSGIVNLSIALQHNNTLQRLQFPGWCKGYFSEHELDSMDSRLVYKYNAKLNISTTI